MNVSSDRRNVQVQVSDYGPIKEATVDLRPLTVFVGPSNTGKSYLAILIYALHRFFSGSSYDAEMRATSRRRIHLVPFFLNEPKGDETNAPRDVQVLLEWVQEIRKNPIPSGYVRDLPEEVDAIVREQLGPNENWNDMMPSELARCFGTPNANWLIRHHSKSDANVSLLALGGGEQTDAPLTFGFGLSPDGFSSTWSISDLTRLQINRDNAEILQQRFRFLQSLPEDEARPRTRLWQSLVRELAGLVGSTMIAPLSQRAHYLPADRTGVMHAHQVVVASMFSRLPTAGLGSNLALPNLSGVLSDFLTQLLLLGNLQTDRRGNRQDPASNIEEQMLRGTIQTDRSNPIYPIFTYLPNGWKTELPLMNSSSMVSYLAPIVLYLRHVAERGDVLIIEEPESNLHPAMQVELIRQIAAVVNSGVRVILTTHSEWVLEELANMVRLADVDVEKRTGNLRAVPALNHQDVGVWLFDKPEHDEGSRVREIALDPEEGGFASGYDQIARLTYNQWARIQNLIEG